MLKDSFYFPHFYNSRNDLKIRRIRKELGIEGYGIFFMILEVLREQTGFKYPVDQIDLLADEFGTSEQKVSSVVFNYNLFNWDNDYFFSPRQIEYLEPYLDKKAKAKISGIKGNLIKYGKASKSDLKEMTDSQIIELNESLKQSSNDTIALLSGGESGCDRKESKVKERKVNKLLSETSIEEDENIPLMKNYKITQERTFRNEACYLAKEIFDAFKGFYEDNRYLNMKTVKEWIKPVKDLINAEYTVEQIKGVLENNFKHKEEDYNIQIFDTKDLRDKFPKLIQEYKRKNK